MPCEAQGLDWVVGGALDTLVTCRDRLCLDVLGPLQLSGGSAVLEAPGPGDQAEATFSGSWGLSGCGSPQVAVSHDEQIAKANIHEAWSLGPMHSSRDGRLTPTSRAACLRCCDSRLGSLS